MKKLLKLIGFIVGIGILLAILIIVCLFTFVNPNRFKPLITEKIKQNTGLQLIIEGDLTWSIFPTLGIKAEHLSLANPPEFKQRKLVEIEQMMVSVRFLPLLHKKIESEGILLDGIKLNLIKNAAGAVNWALPLPVKKSAVESTASTGAKKALLSFMINGIDVKHGEINYFDEKTNQVIHIKHFILQAKQINGFNPFPLVTEFDYAATNPTESGHAKLNSEVALDINHQIYSFRNIDWLLEAKKAKQKIKLALHGDIIADLNQDSVKWSNLTGAMDPITFSGDVGITGIKQQQPHLSGQLNIEPFDLKAWLASIGQDVTNIQTAKEASGHVELMSTHNNMLAAKGALKIDTLQMNHIKLTHVIMPFQYQDNTFSILGLSGDFYQGTLQTNAVMQFKNAKPILNLTGKLSRFQLGDLLADLGAAKQKISLTGVGNINFTLGMQGGQLASLNGSAQLSMNDGTIKGVDMAYLINSARTFAKTEANSVTNTHQTAFSHLAATMVFRNGILSNTDLSLQTTVTHSSGSGTIDLIKKTINYQLLTTINQGTSQKDDKNNLYGVAIPIMIVGSLDDPKVAVNAQAILNAVAKMQLKQAESGLSEQFKKHLKRRVTGGLLLHNLLGH